MFQSWQRSRISWAAQRFYRFEFWSLELWLDLNAGLQHWWWMPGSHAVLLGCWLLTGVVTCLVRRAGQLIFDPAVQGKGQFPSDASGCEHMFDHPLQLPWSDAHLSVHAGISPNVVTHRLWLHGNWVYHLVNGLSFLLPGSTVEPVSLISDRFVYSLLEY